MMVVIAETIEMMTTVHVSVGGEPSLIFTEVHILAQTITTLINEKWIALSLSQILLIFSYFPNLSLCYLR
jgi:hypothetical protein